MTSFLTRRRLQGGVTGFAVAALVLTTAACGGTTRGEEETTSGGGDAAASANPTSSDDSPVYCSNSVTANWGNPGSSSAWTRSV